MDNVFVFAVIFSYFSVPMKYQYRVLFWGILGAVVMRLTFVLVGGELIKRFEFITYALGLFLVWTAFKLAFSDEEADPEKGWTLRLSRRFLPISKENYGEKFFVREAGKACITPLFLVLIVIDATDFAFAFDSVPAIFAFTDDPFIVFSSNVFAILGLRALYFLLAGVMDMFRYLKYGLSAILLFVGLKMLVQWVADPPAWYIEQFGMPPVWAQHWIGHPPAWASLVVVLGLLVISMGASVLHAKLEEASGKHKPHGHGSNDGAAPAGERDVKRGDKPRPDPRGKSYGRISSSLSCTPLPSRERWLRRQPRRSRGDAAFRHSL